MAARESEAAFQQGKLWAFIRHTRISTDEVSLFWDRMAELVDEFDRTPRSGQTMYGFAIGIDPPTTQPCRQRSDARSQAIGQGCEDLIDRIAPWHWGKED